MDSINDSTSRYVVREDLVGAQQKVLSHIGSPGTWLTARERVAVAAEVREAKRCGLCRDRKRSISPYQVDGEHATLEELPGDWVEVIHRVATDSGRVTHSWLNKMLSRGIPDTHYVEIVAIIAQITAIDTFTHAVGFEPYPLPESEDGEPSRYRPAEARVTDAWVPTIVWEEAGPHEADFMSGPGSNIRRALTLVPDEARSFFGLGHHQYWPRDAYHDLTGQFRAISRQQIELLAGRISAINQCAY